MVDYVPFPADTASAEDTVTDRGVKQDKRRYYRRVRRAYHCSADFQPASELLCRHLVQLWKDNCPEPRATVAAFLPYGGEPDIMGFIDHVYGEGGRVMVPYTNASMDLGWGEYAGADSIRYPEDVSFGQPTGPVLPASVIGEAQLIVVPALAVDQQGRRVGQGGGWYDRVLQYRAPEATMVAAIFDAMFSSAALPEASHDVRMDGVVTESGYYQVS